MNVNSIKNRYLKFFLQKGIHLNRAIDNIFIILYSECVNFHVYNISMACCCGTMYRQVAGCFAGLRWLESGYLLLTSDRNDNWTRVNITKHQGQIFSNIVSFYKTAKNKRGKQIRLISQKP